MTPEQFKHALIHAPFPSDISRMELIEEHEDIFNKCILEKLIIMSTGTDDHKDRWLWDFFWATPKKQLEMIDDDWTLFMHHMERGNISFSW